MSENPVWQVSLARSSDMRQIGSLPYAFTLSPIFNRPGSFQMTIKLDDAIAYRVAKHSTCVVCERNEEVFWSGSVVSAVKSASEMTMTISALGWLDELNHRFVRPEEEAGLKFVNVPGGQIAQQLMATVNAQKDTSGVVRPTHLGFQLYRDTQSRTRSYQRGQSYWSALQELSDIEDGFDIHVNPATRAISTFPPTFYADRQGVVFGYGVEPFNLDNVTESDDGSATTDRVNVVGSNGLVVVADDPAAIRAQDAMIENWISVSDVSSSTILGAYANAELVYGRYGHISYDLKPSQFGDSPRLGDDFDLGDKVYLSADAGALQLDKQAIRVFAATLEVDAQGNEVFTQIATAPQ